MHPADVGYRGLWRRRLLRDATGEDRDTQVWWLQGDGWYVDLRIPPGRPDFTGVAGFDQCNDEQLAWLARQQGFAGRLDIDGNRLHWQRQIDFQPTSALADIGEVHWNGECLHERGVLADYDEEWQWQQPITQISQHWLTRGGHGLRVLTGNWFMQALDHRSTLPTNTGLAELIRQPGAVPSALLDCSLDFGLFDHSTGKLRILASCLPWREGRFLPHLEEGQDLPSHPTYPESNPI